MQTPSVSCASDDSQKHVTSVFTCWFQEVGEAWTGLLEGSSDPFKRFFAYGRLRQQHVAKHLSRSVATARWATKSCWMLVGRSLIRQSCLRRSPCWVPIYVRRFHHSILRCGPVVSAGRYQLRIREAGVRKLCGYGQLRRCPAATLHGASARKEGLRCESML